MADIGGSFKMVVEGKDGFERDVPFPHGNVPHLIRIGDEYFTLIGKYASLGERFSYRRAEVYTLT